MKLIINLLVFLLGFFAFYSCKNSDCPEGYECVNDECICLDNKFELKGLSICKELEAGEYFGISDCLFTDTLFIKFETKDVSSNIYFGELTTSFDGGLTRSIDHIYIEQSQFDSLLSIYIFDPDREINPHSLFGQPRFYEDVRVGANLSGRLTEDRFEGNVEWRIVSSFQGNRIGELVESCPITLVTQ